MCWSYVPVSKMQAMQGVSAGKWRNKKIHFVGKTILQII